MKRSREERFKKSIEELQERKGRADEERFKKGVEELQGKIGRAEYYMGTQLMEDKSMERSSSRYFMFI